MTLVLSEADRLIAPDDSLSVRPPSLRALPRLKELDLPKPATEPGFVLTTRALAEAHPKSPSVLARLAQAELGAGNREAATDAARKAARLATAERDASVGIAAVQVLAAVSQEAEAKKFLSRLPDSQAKKMLEARFALSTHAISDAQELLKQSDSVEALATRAWLALEAREFRAAAQFLRRALKRTGPNVNLLVNLGCSYAGLGELDRALSATRQARHLDPSSRLVRLNLVSFLRAAGAFNQAATEVRELQHLYPADLDLVFAEADMRLGAEDVSGALKTLTRARTSDLWASSGDVERAELEANLSFVRWRLGRQSRRETFEELSEKLRHTNYESLEIAGLLPALSREADQAKVLETTFGELRKRHPEANLRWLSVRIELLHLNFDKATELAVEWEEHTPFSASAASTAVFLLAEVAQDFEKAIAIGQRAIKRSPGSRSLRNNLAYALALAGRLKEADALLPPESSNVHFTATRALISLLQGHIEEGIAGYRHAHQLAVERGDAELAALVRYHEIVYRVRALRELGDVRDADLVIRFPSDWEVRPELVIIGRIANREGVTLIVEAEPKQPQQP